MRRVFNVRWEDYRYLPTTEAWVGKWCATVAGRKATHIEIPCVFTVKEDTPEIRRSVKVQGYEVLEFMIEETIAGRNNS